MGDLSCGATFAQIFLVIVNTIFTLLGLALLVVGCLLKFNADFITSKASDLLTEIRLDELNVDLSSVLNSIALIFIIAGAFILLVGFLGCAGACCKFRPLLVIYAIIVLLLFILQVAAVAVTLTMRSSVDKVLKTALNDTLVKKYKGDNSTETLSIAFNNMFFKCCGVDDYMDVKLATNWIRNYTVNGNSYTLETPIHCCKDLGNEFPPQIPNDLTCATNPTQANSNYKTIICIIFAFCICREIGKRMSTNSNNLLLGVAFIVVGCLLRFQEKFVVSFVDDLLTEIQIESLNMDMSSLVKSLAIIIIVIGGVVLVIGLLGMVGACCRVRIFLVVYAVLVILIIVLQVVAVVFTFVMKSDCCGVDNYKDLHNLTKWTRGSALGQQYQTPLHCCHDVTGEYPKVCLPSGDDVLCALTPMRYNSNFEKGCYNEIMDWLTTYGKIELVISICFLMVEILCIILACCLCRSIGNVGKKYEENRSDIDTKM
ncbi:hypothetical protein KUTeg_013085 [Tegillarca granosa]|uniref:Tetraspanin n=1 Tax=Tegillarca granosa TaxID=220873 RepID=A0ABQ9ESN8_TEGGR|nr:hypothetical protein KUTeg_013085 [Tegillarca granosa]